MPKEVKNESFIWIEEICVTLELNERVVDETHIQAVFLSA